MRIRQIKPSFWLNEDLAKLSHLARLTWVGLWAIADRAGRMEARPQRIRGQLFPYEPEIQIDEILSELQTGGFLVRYENDGAWYFEIPNFTKHQRFSGQEAKNDSTLPGPKESGSVPASKEEAKPASKEEASNVRSSDIRSTDNGKTESAPKPKRTKDSPEAQEVIRHYRQTREWKKDVIWNPHDTDRKTIEQRLSEGWTVDQLKSALDAAKKDGFWVSKGPGAVLKDAARVQDLVGQADREPKYKSFAQFQADQRAAGVIDR